MAEQNGGCALLLILGALLLVVAFWQYVLVALLVAGVASLLLQLAGAMALSRLRTITRAADQRFRGDACRAGDHFALIEGIETEPNSIQPRILVHTGRIGSEEGDLTRRRDCHRLSPPRDLSTISSNLAFSRFLENQGIEMVNDLAVEARAAKAAMHCLQESEWARNSLRTLEGLIRSASETLAKARGNELLEPAIPQLQQALTAFEAEKQKLSSYLEDSLSILKKLHDFLGVPAAIRPILSFDLDQLFDPARFKELEASFEEVVSLNQAFHALSRDKLA